jgi:hypothetical protein
MNVTNLLLSVSVSHVAIIEYIAGTMRPWKKKGKEC